MSSLTYRQTAGRQQWLTHRRRPGATLCAPAMIRLSWYTTPRYLHFADHNGDAA
jgi:predicted phage-related endonuclease